VLPASIEIITGSCALRVKIELRGINQKKKTVLNPERESRSEGDKSCRSAVKADLVAITYRDFSKPL